MFLEEEQQKCGCGKDIRYSTSCGKGACNKYQRCLSYEEQAEIIAKLIPKSRYYEVILEKITKVDAMDYEYRTWAKEALDKYKV